MMSSDNLIETMDNDPVADAIGLYIVNCHGINLCSVRSIKVTRTPGGDLSGIHVKFIPEPVCALARGETSLKTKLAREFRSFVSTQFGIPESTIRDVMVTHQVDEQISEIKIKIRR